MRAVDDITNYLHILNSEYLSQLLLTGLLNKSIV